MQLEERWGNIRDFVPRSSSFGVKQKRSLAIVQLQRPSCEHPTHLSLPSAWKQT